MKGSAGLDASMQGWLEAALSLIQAHTGGMEPDSGTKGPIQPTDWFCTIHLACRAKTPSGIGTERSCYIKYLTDSNFE